MDRMERREILLAGVAASAGLVLGAQGAETAGWIKNYDPKEIAEMAMEELDFALKNSRWIPPKKMTDTTVVPHFQDTAKMKRNFERGNFEDDQIIEVNGQKYKLDWIVSTIELTGPVSFPQLRADHILPTFSSWRKHFAEQPGEGALIVTRMPTKDVSRRRPVNNVKMFTLVEYDLALRVTVMTGGGERTTIVFDSLVGTRA